MSLHAPLLLLAKYVIGYAIIQKDVKSIRILDKLLVKKADVKR